MPGGKRGLEDKQGGRSPREPGGRKPGPLEDHLLRPCLAGPPDGKEGGEETTQDL